MPKTQQRPPRVGIVPGPQLPGVDCRWHRTQWHQPGGPGRTCRTTAPCRATGARLAQPISQLCRVRGCTQAVLMPAVNW